MQSSTRSAGRDVRSRASVLIGYVRWLRANQYYEAVAARVTPALRQLMEEPPIRTAWVSGRDLESLLEALGTVTTPAECRRLGRDVTRDTVLPAIRPILEAALRRASASPAVIYERLDVMMKMVVPDMSVAYRALGPTAGEATVGWPYAPNDATLELWAGSLEIGLELCGKQGGVMILGRPTAHEALFGIEWR